MTNKWKQKVRARMESDGVTYSEALRRMRADVVEQFGDDVASRQEVPTGPGVTIVTRHEFEPTFNGNCMWCGHPPKSCVGGTS